MKELVYLRITSQIGFKPICAVKAVHFDAFKCIGLGFEKP